MERINIIGAGLAGLSAAIALAEGGRPSNLVSAQASERAQSVLAEGGINAALDIMGEGDTWQEHRDDTLRGGADLADPAAVAGLAQGAPDIVRRLAALGVPFQMENGRMIQRNFGGQRKKRTAYARSSTGKALMTALIDAARRYEAEGLIRRYPNHEFQRLIVEDGRCVGARARDSYTGRGIELMGRVILCCGGLNGFFPEKTTGTTQNTGDAAAAAFAQGVAFANLEFIQYHPTTVGIAGKRCLISEAARGEGGRLCALRGGKPWYFMEELYPELGNLMPRDVVSREMERVARLPDCGGQVYLDLTGLSDAVWQRRLSDLREECMHYLAVDPAVALVPVEPGIHFFMGGVDVDLRHRTNLSGLWAAGECACQYHGANRLGGNSMLGAIYGGAVAAGDILSEPAGPEAPDRDLGPADGYGTVAADAFALRLRDILLGALGMLRDEAHFDAAIARVDALLAEDLPGYLRDRALLGKAMLLAGKARRESRGAHTRTDCPERDEAFRRTTILRRRGDEVTIEYRDIPERGGEDA